VAVPPGHTMSYGDTLHVATNDFIIKLLTPGWALGLTPKLQKVKVAFEELRVRRQKKVPRLFFPKKIACIDVYRGNDTRA
jgi:hypothetical protein